MFPRVQFGRPGNALLRLARSVALLLCISALLSCAGLVRAQDSPPAGTVGRVEGNDISVDGGTSAGLGIANTTPGILVANGSVVTVHSGQARMMLSAGGQLDICGPAKLTVLQSNGAITVALNFGRVHIELPASTSLRIFTPSIIATPIDIGGAARDVAVGLNLDDSLCVLATSGALQLEHQFTGEKLIVPQAGEFFLAGGQLVPVAGAAGSCQCAEIQTRVPVTPSAPYPSQPAPSNAMLVAPAIPPAFEASSTSGTTSAPVAAPPAPEPSVSYSILGHADESRPNLPAPKNSVPAAPAISVPVYTAVAPLIYSGGNPIHPPEPNPDMVLLIREARVDPDWEFSGRVEAPNFAVSMQHALGIAPGASQPQGSAANQTPAKQKKRGGFWSGFKRLFGGGGPNPSGGERAGRADGLSRRVPLRTDASRLKSPGTRRTKEQSLRCSRRRAKERSSGRRKRVVRQNTKAPTSG